MPLQEFHERNLLHDQIDETESVLEIPGVVAVIGPLAGRKDGVDDVAEQLVGDGVYVDGRVNLEGPLFDRFDDR